MEPEGMKGLKEEKDYGGRRDEGTKRGKGLWRHKSKIGTEKG